MLVNSGFVGLVYPISEAVTSPELLFYAFYDYRLFHRYLYLRHDLDVGHVKVFRDFGMDGKKTKR